MEKDIASLPDNTKNSNQLQDKPPKYKIDYSLPWYFITKTTVEIIKDNYQSLLTKANKTNKLKPHKIPHPNYYQRYYLFSKYNSGIQIDIEGWTTVTPEAIAEHIALMTEGKTVIDAFCGIGGNTIHFSKHCSKVIAVELKAERLELCKKNCSVYKCKDNIVFVWKDFLTMELDEKVDYVFLSPPWGGDKYKGVAKYSLKSNIQPELEMIIKTAFALGREIIIYLPKNSDLKELYEVVAPIYWKAYCKEDNEKKNIWFDLTVLESNKRTKAILVHVGRDFDKRIVEEEKELEEFALRDYSTDEKQKVRFNIIKQTIGLFTLVREEEDYRLNIAMGDAKKMTLHNLLTYIEKQRLNYQNQCLVNSIKNGSLKKDKNHKSNDACSTNSSE